jgi:stage II sporulation protein D
MRLLGAALLLALASGPARAEDAAIRVLLHEGVRRVTVEPAGGRERRIDARRLRGRIELPAPGPHGIDGRRYRGAVTIEPRAGGLRVVNEVPLEAYVAGTLLGEVHESWGDAVLRAQAIAIRSYALHRRARAAGRAFDVEADTRGQVYLGMDGESEAAWRAVEATRGQILTWEGEAILAAFHGTAGGRTASAAEVWGREVPYLASVPVEGEEVSPDTYWRAPVSAEELRAALAALGRDVGRVERVEIAARTPSGRAARLRVRGAAGEVEVPAPALRRVLGERRLRSTRFELRPGADGGVVFVGSGRGHGVGMSQWGARAMAERGAGHRAILERFYPGAQLVSIEKAPADRVAAGGSW